MSRDEGVVLYATSTCSYCRRARELLRAKEIAFTEHAVDRNPALRAEMMQRSGRYTVPQIFIRGRHVGGYDDLLALERKGELDDLLAA